MYIEMHVIETGFQKYVECVWGEGWWDELRQLRLQAFIKPGCVLVVGGWHIDMFHSAW